MNHPNAIYFKLVVWFLYPNSAPGALVSSHYLVITDAYRFKAFCMDSNREFAAL